MVVGIFGPTFEDKGFVYDREALHTLIESGLAKTDFQSIPRPEWAEGIEISGSSGWTPARSDWYFIERDGVGNYMHLTSAHDGLAIDLWANVGVMYHQRSSNPDQCLKNQLELSTALESELHREWGKWCESHRKDRITKRSTEVAGSTY